MIAIKRGKVPRRRCPECGKSKRFRLGQEMCHMCTVAKEKKAGNDHKESI